MTQSERLEYLINALLADPACAYAIGGTSACLPRSMTVTTCCVLS